MNLAQLLAGPAVAFHRGVAFESRGGQQLNASNEAFPIESDRFGPIDQRSADSSVQLSLTPIGVWKNDVLPVLYRWTNPHFGQLVTPVWEFEAIDTDEDEITITGIGGLIREGCPVRLGTRGTLPGGLSAANLYYVGIEDDDTVTLHLTQAHALAGTNKVDITSAGTDESSMVEQEPLVIHTAQGRRITFHNAALTQMPELIFAANQTLLGQVGFEAFRINNTPWSTANSLYTVDKSPLAVDGPSAGDIPTLEYTLGWGGVAPWASFQTRDAFRIQLQLGLERVGGPNSGTLSRQITSLTAVARGQPDGISESNILAALELQGGSSRVGKSLSGLDLVAAATGVHVTLYNAVLNSGPMLFQNNTPRAGELEWVSSRRFTAGVPAPVFRVGTAAPSA
jgi:hypothetical protein